MGAEIGAAANSAPVNAERIPDEKNGSMKASIVNQNQRRNGMYEVPPILTSCISNNSPPIPSAPSCRITLITCSVDQTLVVMVYSKVPNEFVSEYR